ncbi:MAG TPA: hypothetical protein ENH40_01795 [Nitrospirae bacterium]|nr:hypothetical protein [Nitrospirota bacterium]
MISKKGWDEEFMMSFFLKEASYDAGVSMVDANACGMKGFEVGVEWDDEVVSDKDAVTGSEHGTDQEINTQSVKINYKEPRARPNTVAGLAALVMGDITSTLDVAGAYAHKIIPVAIGTAIPSIQAEHKKGGVQYTYKGVKGESIKLAGEAGGYVSVESPLIGSGTRATSATAFAAKITESWMKISNCKFWLESGADIDISAALAQNAEDISSVSPEDLKVRFKSFEWTFSNNPEKQIGCGGAGVAQDIDYGRRSVEFKFSLLFNGTSELDNFLNQDVVALELDLKGGLIPGGGTSYYGLQLIIPRVKFKSAPLPQGGVGDILTQEIECDTQDNGTDAISILEVYTAQAAYLS